MSTDLSLKETQKEWHGTLKGYIIGFVAALILTCASFFLVFSGWIQGNYLIYILFGLALIQAIVQVIFFLHLGQEAKPRWETMIFGFMVLVLFIVVLGSLWIMYDLHDRGMGSNESEMIHD